MYLTFYSFLALSMDCVLLPLFLSSSLPPPFLLPSQQQQISVRDMATAQLLDGDESDGDDDDGDRPMPYFAEQEHLKKKFLSEVSQLGEDSDSGDGGFKLRVKTEEEKRKEKDEYEKFKEEHADELAKYASKMGKNKEENEFLTNYLLNQWWKAKDTEGLPSYKEIVGEDEPDQPDMSEDEDYLDAQDNFEAEYNFRFEEPGSHEIITHSRVIEDSMRNKESKRKRQREAKKKRDEEKKKKKLEQIKSIKNKKKAEIVAKLKEIEAITGSDHLPAEGLDLEDDFDPDEYDRQMEQMFSDNYYDEDINVADEEEKLKDIIGRDSTSLFYYSFFLFLFYLLVLLLYLSFHFM